MKATFNKVKEQLKDPVFKAKYLSKNLIKQRISPLEEYPESPDNFQFIDWKKEDDKELICYQYANTEIGRLLIANTSKGVCFVGFSCDNDAEVKVDFQKRFPQQPIEEQSSDLQKLVVDYCNSKQTQIIPLHLRGTNFQLDIWKKLVRIPEGKLSTYGSLTAQPKASRAVGSAVGANPVSYIIPCHRVVRGTGDFRGYHWGPELKEQLLAFELRVEN